MPMRETSVEDMRRAAAVSHRLPCLQGLRTFTVVARVGSFETAAKALNVTSSAVSKRIATLEVRLGFRLFERFPNSVTLTPVGHEYLQMIAPALSALEAMPQHHQNRS